MIHYEIKSARQSDLSLLPVKIILVDLNVIGTHEDIEQDKFDQVLDSILKNGYSGPAISVIEKGQDDVFKNAKQDEHVEFKFGNVGIADGHNRLAALKNLYVSGKLKTNTIPVQIIPGRMPEIVQIKTLSAEEKPLSIEDIETHFGEGSIIPKNSTSHFETKLSNGEFVRVREAQPDLIIKPEDLLH